jgi:flavin-dependent dehydrogenase
MHVRQGHYIGVAPVPDDLVNVCLVVTDSRDGRWRDPASWLREVLGRDARLRERFAHAEMVDGPHVLGPMAVDATAAGAPGLLLAGDAAGFIDPITGDGLRLALEGAELAAGVVLDTVAGRCSWRDAPTLLAARRRAVFARKWRFNRAIRAVLTRPAAVSGAAVAARAWPGAFRQVIRYAGDTPLCLLK